MVSLFGLWPYGAAVPKLLLAVSRKDAAECLRCLDMALSEAQKPWNMKKSPLYCRRSEAPNAQEVGRRWSRTLLLEIEDSEEYDFLRGNEELEKIMKTYAEDTRSRVKRKIYFTGGLPDRLMDRIKEFELYDIVMDHNEIVMGYSAGALV